MHSHEPTPVRELLAKLKSGIYLESDFHILLSRKACTDGWSEISECLSPEELKKFRAWVRKCFQGPDVNTYWLCSVPPLPYTQEQEEFLFRWGREGDDEDSLEGE